MKCHDTNQNINLEGKKKILLMGNPNVGKSVIFSRLTNLDVMTSNYTGTTVSYTYGIIRHQGRQAVLVDVPGVYSLNPISEAEKVATEMLDDGADLILCVLDSTHLERNLELAYEIQKYNIPIIYSVNLCDVAKRRGIKIDIEKLREHLNAPVFETIAVKREGINELKAGVLKEHQIANKEIKYNDKYEFSKNITDDVLTEEEVNFSFFEKLSDWSIRPLTGIPIALLVLGIALAIVVGGGKGLRSLILLPLIDNYIVPFITQIVSLLVPDGIFLNILVGEFGVLVKGIEWPFALILPYVFLFYIVFSFLEDSGYLPRLGVLMDGIFRKLGLPGNNIVPFIMGYGCAVPAILGTRASGSKKERIIVASLITLAVPCISQSAAFFSLLGEQSIIALIFVYLVSFIMIIIAGLFLNRILKGRSRPLILELPNLLFPDMKSLFKKIWIRLKHFLFEATIPMMFGILLAALLFETGLMVYISNALQPLVEGWLGLPKEASISLLLGIIRRELAVVPLLEMDLNIIQLITGAIVALFYLPCISVLVVLAKEFKFKFAILISLTTIVFAFVAGGITNHVLTFLFELSNNIFK